MLRVTSVVKTLVSSSSSCPSLGSVSAQQLQQPRFSRLLTDTISTRFNLTNTSGQKQRVATALRQQTSRQFSHWTRNPLTAITTATIEKPGILSSSSSSLAAYRPYNLRATRLRPYSSSSPRGRRPFRFLFKAILVSTAVIAIPATLAFGFPAASFVFIPLVVGGLVGGMFLLTGGILFFVFPIVVFGSALTFSVCALPAAVNFKDLNQIVKGAENLKDDGAALEALGQGWEIQRANPKEEWFHWRFPKNDREVDKISVRMQVFDPEDQSNRKEKTIKWLDDMQRDGKEDDNIRSLSSSGRSNFQFRNNSDSSQASIQNLSINRENDHLLIQIEDDGAKLLNQKWSKKYLQLAQVVDKAATEMERRQSGLTLGNQIVLVRRKEYQHSFWNKFSLLGDIALRIPFDRTWIHDVSDDEN
ncbi:hypothetical protein EDD11_004657 [Mortierella claussenii]|nr:hypothetical protein EDD11_004657 [Mortierella claussenii]